MSNFTTIRTPLISAKEVVEQLVIDGKKQMDVFEESLQGTTYLSEYKTLLKYIEYLANGNALPRTKFRHLAGATDGIPEHEFKSKHLRIYAVQMPSKKLIVFLGTKSNQDADIAEFRGLKEKYLQTLKMKKNEKK